VPSRPYFHGREDFYLQDGALIAYAEPFTNRHGLRCHGLVKVLTRDRRYELGHALVTDDGGVVHGCVWADARRDRRYGLHSLDELIRACQEVYGAHPRYDIDPPEEP
jgi:hypothetical protein